MGLRPLLNPLGFPCDPIIGTYALTLSNRKGPECHVGRLGEANPVTHESASITAPGTQSR